MRFAGDVHAQIVGAELDDGDVGAGTDGVVEAAQRAGGGVAGNAGVLDLDVVALFAQHGLQLRRIGVLARHQPAGGGAVAEGDDGDGAGGGRDGRRKQKRDGGEPAASSTSTPPRSRP